MKPILFSKATKTTLLFGVLMNAPQQISAKAEDSHKFGPTWEHNFGEVVQNETYQIYRGNALGAKGLKELSKHLKKVGEPFPKTIIYMNSAGYNLFSFPFYFALEEYKSQEEYGFTYYHPFDENFRTYVDGENPYFPTRDIDGGNILDQKSKKYFRYFDDGVDGGVETFLAILKVVLDPQNQPVLFHCQGGFHRTGMMAMALRTIQGGYWTEGPQIPKKDMMLNPAQQEYAEFNPNFFRSANIAFINALSQDPRFLELKAQYQDALRDGSEE